MSLSTWKELYYSVPASSVPKEEAVSHSLVKWRGLRKEVLERHGIRLDLFIGPRIDDGESRLYIDTDSCALCQHYYEEGGERCPKCPLAAALCAPCDYGMASPWDAFADDGNPEPMISALEAAQKLEEEGGSR